MEVYIPAKLIVKSFQRSCHVQLDLDILFIKLTAQIGHLKNTLCTLRLKSEYWRRYTCANVFLVCVGEIGELVQPGSM